MTIKSVKFTKTVPIELTSITSKEDTDEISFIESYSFSVKWKLTSYMDDVDDEELSLNQNITIQKIEHFVKNYLNNAVWYDRSGVDMINNKFAECENLLLITPSLNFTILGLCLFAKFNSLCKPGIVISELYFEDPAMSQSFEYSDYDGEIPAGLPVSKEEWMGELSIWDQPWWCRDDLSTYDNVALDQEELDNIKHQVQEAEEAILGDFELIEDHVKQILSPGEAEVIEIDFEQLKEKSRWKPKLIK